MCVAVKKAIPAMVRKHSSPRLPNAKSARTTAERGKIRRVIAERGLAGLANDTKWDELIAAVRAHEGWRPSYRYKCVDGPPSGWDVEWFYHLPFPLISVEWLDIAFIGESRPGGRSARPVLIDHSGWIEAALREAGLDYRKGKTMFRVYGYSPRSDDLFDDEPRDGERGVP
jgi:hypothetical protein